MDPGAELTLFFQVKEFLLPREGHFRDLKPPQKPPGRSCGSAAARGSREVPEPGPGGTGRAGGGRAPEPRSSPYRCCSASASPRGLLPRCDPATAPRTAGRGLPAARRCVIRREKLGIFPPGTASWEAS